MYHAQQQKKFIILIVQSRKDKYMKRKVITIIVGIFFILSLMFAEYRFIMHNIYSYIGENNTVYLEIFGQTDEYYAEPMEN